MIVAAGLLVLLGLGLFLAGVLTGATAFYWLCVAVCVLAAVLLSLARRRIARAESATPEHAVPAASAVASAAPAGSRTSSGPTRATNPTATFPAVSDGGQPTGATASGLGEPAGESTGAHATRPPGDRGGRTAPREPEPVGSRPAGGPRELRDPAIEDVEVTDLLLVVDLKDEVLVVDEHPRYHLSGCPHLRGRTEIPLPLDEARGDGFTPCAVCAPDRNLADRERARRHSGGAA